MKPLREITLRKFPSPQGSFRERVQFFALSIGLSRSFEDIISDVLYILLIQARSKEWISSRELAEKIRPIRPNFAESTVRRALKLLVDLGFADRERAKYRLHGFLGLTDVYQKYLDSSVKNVIDRITQSSKDIDLMNVQ